MMCPNIFNLDCEAAMLPGVSGSGPQVALISPACLAQPCRRRHSGRGLMGSQDSAMHAEYKMDAQRRSPCSCIVLSFTSCSRSLLVSSLPVAWLVFTASLTWKQPVFPVHSFNLFFSPLLLLAFEHFALDFPCLKPALLLCSQLVLEAPGLLSRSILFSASSSIVAPGPSYWPLH